MTSQLLESAAQDTTIQYSRCWWIDYCMPYSQDAFARLALDVLLAGGGFEYNVSALDFKPCKLLNELQFCTEEVAL